MEMARLIVLNHRAYYLKNQDEIINIINTANAHKINIAYRDEIYTAGNESFGTSVTIKIPNTLHDGNG